MPSAIVRILLTATVLLPLGAVEPATASWAELTIPDGARLLSHWAASPIGRAWADAGVAPLRARLDRELPALVGLDPFAVLADSSHLRVALTSIDGTFDEPRGRLQAQVELGATAQQAFAAIAKKGTAVPLQGADEAALLGEGETAMRLLRHDRWLQLGPAVDPIPAPLTGSGEHDLDFHIAGPRFADWLLKVRPASADGPSEAQIRALLPQIDGQLDLGAVGGILRITIGTPAPWLAPITQASFKRLNGNVLDLSAVGIDGQELWRAVEPLVQRLEKSGKPGSLAELGITSTWQQLVTGLGGTWAVVITPAMPAPAYSVVGPRSPGLDELLGLLARKYECELPAEGAFVTLMPKGLPISLSLARTADQWLMSSDPMFAASWAGTADGGWQGSPLGTLANTKLAGDGCILLVGDTQAQVRSLIPLVTMGLSAMPGIALQPAERQAVMTFMTRLAANVGSGWNVARHQGDTVVVTGEGMLASGGSVPVAAVMAGMLLPAINMVREGARKANSGNNMRQLVLGCNVWANDNDQLWPPTIEKMRQDIGGDIPDKVMRSPGDPTNRNPYLYIRPTSAARAIQPAIVEDPACWKGKGCMVAFCDGHVAWIPRERAQRVWAEAQRLAALPKAAIKDQGIATDDWAAVQEDLTPRPGDAPSR